jgi:hypothetical protein
MGMNWLELTTVLMNERGLHGPDSCPNASTTTTTRLADRARSGRTPLEPIITISCLLYQYGCSLAQKQIDMCEYFGFFTQFDGSLLTILYHVRNTSITYERYECRSLDVRVARALLTIRVLDHQLVASHKRFIAVFSVKCSCIRGNVHMLGILIVSVAFTQC